MVTAQSGSLKRPRGAGGIRCSGSGLGLTMPRGSQSQKVPSASEAAGLMTGEVVSPEPELIQGGMGVGISSWELARAVAQAGERLTRRGPGGGSGGGPGGTMGFWGAGGGAGEG